MSQSRASRASRVTAGNEGQSRTPRPEDNTPRSEGRNSNPPEETRQSAMSNRSPAAISRTPSADRRLLRALTVSPNTGEYKEDEVDDATPEPQYSARQSTQNRQSTRLSVNRTPTQSVRGSPNRVSETPAQNDRHSVINIPSPVKEGRGVS